MKKIILIVLFLFPSCLFAQQDIILGQYMFNGLVVNPAYAGTHKYFNVTGFHRRQWMNIEGSPVLQGFTLDGPVRNKKIGVGLEFLNEKQGISDRTNVYGTYAYHMKMLHGTLSMGFRGGVTISHSKYTEVTYWDENDPAFANNLDDVSVSKFGAGLYYHSTRFYLGASMPFLFNYNLKNASESSLIKTTYITSGYAFPINEFTVIKPSFLIRYTPESKIYVDYNVNVLFNNFLWVGASYRNNESIAGLLEILISPRLRVGYSYDNSLSSYTRNLGASHEMVISFDFGYQATKMKNPRYF